MMQGLFCFISNATIPSVVAFRATGVAALLLLLLAAYIPVEVMSNASRGNMLNAIKAGAGVAIAGVSAGLHSGKSILARGCDPVMAAKSTQMLPPLLGGVEVVACTSDDEFVKLLQERKYTAVFFAPGACRFDAAKQPIPGGNKRTAGWDLAQYRGLVRELQGEAVEIVETTQEAQIVSLLAQALAAADEKEIAEAEL